MTAPLYVTSPCPACGKPVVAALGIGARKLILDPGVPVYARESDGEGGAVWLQEKQETTMAVHRCTNGRA